jgi:folate-binding protein YgfZ
VADVPLREKRYTMHRRDALYRRPIAPIHLYLSPPFRTACMSATDFPTLADSLASLHSAGIVSAPAGLGLIRVAGDDAATFLHSQLTNGVEDLTADAARLAGYCSPKGRLLASFLMWRDAEGIVLQLSADIQPAIQKRLTMFVLRAKAKLSDLSATHRVLGVAGAGAEAALAQAGLPAPHAPLATAHADGVTVIRLADAEGEPRWQIVAAADQADALHARLAQALAGAAPAFWDWLEIGAGIPRIAAATQEQFVPQMINFELVGGVNFRKGCYPGQEVVARSQYRGTLKRRMWRVHGDGDVPAAAAEVFRPEDPEQPCRRAAGTAWRN